jgi:hypothetical protein
MARTNTSSGGGGGGVTDLNGLTGAVTLSAGNNVTLNESGNDIQISAIGSDVAITVRAATTAALAGTWTYNNGTSGVGATLTRTTNGALPNQDGVSLMDGDRFLIKNQASTLVNGVWVLTQKGVAGVSPTIFTRATDADETSELDELVVTVSEGSTNRGTVWGQQTNNPVVGTSAITFATVPSTAVTQATSGTQVINQIPLYTGTARQLTRGTANFKYNPTNNLFTIRGIDYTFPANNGDASQVLTTDGAGNLSWATGGGGSSPITIGTSVTNSIQFAATGDVIDNANGVTADYDTSTTSDDIFFWFSTNGGSGGPIVITGTAQTLNDGIDITFGSTTGHGVGDSWYWSYKTLKNTVLSNRKIGSGLFDGAINGSYFKSGSGSSTIQAINGFFQNDDDDRIFPLSAYEDLTSGNNADKERAYYGFNPFKGDQTNPLEFVVKTQKGVGPGPGIIEISTLTVGTLSGFEFISDKSFQVSTPLFVTQDSLFSWTGGTNGNGITIDDTNSTATLGNISGGNNTKITVDDVTQLVTISNVPTYADETTAIGAGLTTGQVYKSYDGQNYFLAIVH